MTKATKKTNATTAPVTKKEKTTDTKAAVKKETASITKKITAKPEAKKITTAKEPKKITAAKEPKKITAKPEPKKIAAKDTIKLETKSETKKAVVKKETVKKVAATTKKETEKVAAKKKTEVKKEAVKKTVKKETPVKKETSKKGTEKKKPVSKSAVYNAYSLEECIGHMQAMNVMHVYEDYARFLMDEADIKKITKNIIDGNELKKHEATFDKDGHDIDLVEVTIQKVADTMDIKAADYKTIKKEMDVAVKTTLSEEAEVNAVEYLKEFKICEKILMIGQRKNITSAEEVSTLIKSDIDAFVSHFFTLAYEILPTWQYDDVKFYEDFAYAILSQYVDLYEKYQLRILLDVADLYIKHGDFQHGDECYGYILRDNQIKDYIYYRFASIYEAIDMNKAKTLAYESMQYVDERFEYYPNIVEIMNR